VTFLRIWDGIFSFRSKSHNAAALFRLLQLLFRGCSAFTHVTACTLTESPSDIYTESSDNFVATVVVSIVTGWSEPVPERELHRLKSSACHGALFPQ
jgi:hypothetical protein